MLRIASPVQMDSSSFGTVEEIGLRLTRIRTLNRTVVAVPNGEFVTLHLENFTRRDRIWLKATLGLRCETTPDQRAWRDRSELYLPEFLPVRVGALRASLDYPPNGAAVVRRE